MGKKRFVVLASEGSGFSNAMQEIVNTETGAHYLTWQSGYAGGITSAALDGMLTAEAIINELSNLKG